MLQRTANYLISIGDSVSTYLVHQGLFKNAINQFAPNFWRIGFFPLNFALITYIILPADSAVVVTACVVVL